MELYDSATKPARSCGYFLTGPKCEIYKGLPKDPTDRRVFDVPTEDRLQALAALQEVAQRRLAMIWGG
jgi:hypothetical protein